MTGDDTDFRAFVVARWTSLVRMAYLMTGDRGRAEDLVQSTLERMHRHWARIERRDAPEVYARRVMINQLIASRRRKRLLEVPLSGGPEPRERDAADAVVLHQTMWHALAGLPPRMRAVVVLRYYEDLSEADTAAVLGCAVGTVKSQTSRGLERLRASLDENGAADWLAATQGRTG